MSSFRMAFLLLLTIGLLLTGLVQGLTSTFTPLKVYTHTPGSVEDYERACYSSVVEEKGFVKFGSPEGCGKGCQHISSYLSGGSDFSSEYLYEGRPTLGNVVGKPSDTPSDTLGKALSHSWTSLQPNAGNEFFTFEVAQKTFVTKLDIYQGFNPGAVSKVEAFDTEQVRWVEIWNRNDHATSSSKERTDPNTNAVILTVLAQFRLKLVLAERFRLNLDTSLVVGYNTIDAVKVYGLEENGKPLNEYTPACDGTTQVNCFYECKAFDMVTEESSVANFHVVGSAVHWVESALKVRHVDVIDPEASGGPNANSNEVPVVYSDLEEGSQMCRSLPFTKAVRGMSQHEGDVALVVTQRPSLGGAPIEVKSCARFAAPAVSRPAVIHLNVVPQYSKSAGITKSTFLDYRRHFEAQQPHLHVVDSVVHYLYRALGWDLEFRADFVGYNSANVTTVVQQQGTSWNNRYRTYLNLSEMKQRAETHFGASNMEGVELEDDGLLLSSRLYNGEVMTLPPYVRGASFDFATGWDFAHKQGTDQHEGLRQMARSAISLAYFEETGWYQPDYFAAQHLAWGHLAGNDFVKQNCRTWGMGSESTSRYLCRRSFEPTLYTKTALEAVTYPTAQEKQCSFDRLYKGMCVTKLWGSDIPTHSEYWDVQSGMGGVSRDLDFCPVVVPDPSLSYFNSNFMVNCQDTTGRSQGDPTTRFFEEFGESARCFEANTLGDPAVFTACLTHKCLRTGVLQIKVRDEVEECPANGGKVTFQQSGIAVDCTGYQHLCATYEHLTKPTLSVVSPLDNVVLTTRDLSAQLLIDNYKANHHYLKVYVNDRHYSTVADFGQMSPDEALLTTVSLGALPVTVRSAQNSIRVRYELAEVVDGAEKVHSQVEHSHVVRNTMEQWAKAVNASSEHPDFGFAQGIAQAEDRKGWSPLQIAFEEGPSSHHQVVVSLEKEVQVSQVLVYYNFGYASQQLKSISVENTDDLGSFVMVWRGNETDPTSSSLDSEVVAFSPAPFFSKTVKLEFDGAQWLEVDAIKCVGFLTVLPAFRPVSVSLDIDLPSGGQQDADDKHLFSFEVPFESVHSRDSATVFWEAKINASDWISVKQGQGTAAGGAGAASSTTAHSVTLLVDVTKAPTTEAVVNLTIIDSYETDPLSPPLTSLLLKITNQVDVHNNPPCYDGLLVEENMAFACKCSPGASGSACELHECPANCSGSGVCDSFTGTCKCANGFYGLDCSGKFPKCYVSKDGSCESGFTLGTYVIDSGLPNSVNYAEGNTPHSLLCDGSAKPSNEFSCSSLSTVEFCCQDKELPSCPFFPGSAPCSVPNCPYVSADSFAHLGNKILSANTSTISECTQAVLQHCYSNAHDPGCSGLVQTEIPSAECPLSVIIDECKKMGSTAAGGASECEDLFPKIASFSTCNFIDTTDVLNPCNVPNCRASPYALGECRGYVEAHCAKYPEDRECELHGLGDGCFFLAGSQPCTSVDCLQNNGWETDACKAVIQSYCSYGSQQDPECLVHGYSNNILSETLATFTCPWEKIRASCRGTSSPDSACKLLLRDKLALPGTTSNGNGVKLNSASVEAKLMELHAAAMRAHRNSNAAAGLVSMLLNKISMSQTGNLNTKELTALLSLFPMEAILGQHFVHYSWSEQLSNTLYPILASSGFASEKEIQAEIDTYLGENIVV